MERINNILTLGDIIRLLDPLSKVILWVNWNGMSEEELEDEEPAFKGYIDEIPWVYMDMLVYNKSDYQIRVTYEEENKTPYFVINLLEK